MPPFYQYKCKSRFYTVICTLVSELRRDYRKLKKLLIVPVKGGGFRVVVPEKHLLHLRIFYDNPLPYFSVEWHNGIGNCAEKTHNRVINIGDIKFVVLPPCLHF